eukprot:CAMPEP_0170501692 /NCGR_PEP_ID=MMETSP0208-20121228/39111_1 /TAXON_ID=197538 /ORGANISM="Strombidium inclinatum, Strain S3" /LENGTH=110 /DNA_ID=CAMNT_0010780367 /DNA_START=829 /DNA_END=1161 /DNA_ORIENTATION=-
MEPPSRYFMEVFSHFIGDDLHKEKLKEFSSNSIEGKSEYHRYCVKEKRTALEVLSDFQPSGLWSLPLAFLIQLCGIQKPREFSISSSMAKNHNQLDLTMAVTEYETQLKR